MIKDIYATWGISETKRHILAHISRSENKQLKFSYNYQGLYAASKDGLNHFVGFRRNADNISSERIEDILSLRVISDKRPDKMELLNFWEVPNLTDKIDILAFTQGKSPTDFYEYLPDFTTYSQKAFTFVTDLVEVQKISKTAINIGDQLNYITTADGVVVFNSQQVIGKIKIIHELPFIGGIEANLTVKAIYTSASFIKRIFVKVDVTNNVIKNHLLLKMKYDAMIGEEVRKPTQSRYYV